MAGKTVIAIAHRLSTIARMDRLIVLDRGRIVEQGTHHELLQHGGNYAALCSDSPAASSMPATCRLLSKSSQPAAAACSKRYNRPGTTLGRASEDRREFVRITE
jgi:ABC-type multidrug transport system ATPase subunit